MSINNHLSVKDATFINNVDIYGNLDISSTDALLIPRGTTVERPSNKEIPRALRSNKDTKLYEVYTESNIWSGLPVYKTEQPPKLLDVSQNQSNEKTTVSWSKFDDIYKDAFDGKCYPIYLQTFIDISFTNISDISSNGWKTLIIGNGNYNDSGSKTTPLLSHEFNSIIDTSYANNSIYDISFNEKPPTINLPAFTQDDSFDLRIYGVNKSGTIPNYIYIYSVELKQTGEPGAVSVISFKSFGKTNFNVDLSFNLDKDDLSITNGISITHYDISFRLIETKSFNNKTDASNQYKNWNGVDSLIKQDISLIDLFPGSKYDIQIRSQNALKLDNSTTTGFKYGNYGDISSSTGFTNNNNNTDGLLTTEYIQLSDLVPVSNGGMALSLVKSSNISFFRNGNNLKLTNETICSTDKSYIEFSGTSEFYVNFGLQGIDMSGVNDLIKVTFEIKKNAATYSSSILTYDGADDPLIVPVSTVNLGVNDNSYSFQSGNSYTDKAIDTDSNSRNSGFVYSGNFSETTIDDYDLKQKFKNIFPPSTDSYEFLYKIQSQPENSSRFINKSNVDNITVTVDEFYVDDFSSNDPSINWIVDPSLVVETKSYLFGIPSVKSLTLSYNFKVSDFANHIIPAGVHSSVDDISKNSYSFLSEDKSDIFVNSTYHFSNNKTVNIENARYDDTTTSDFSINVNYITYETDQPIIKKKTITDKSVLDIGHIFKDSVTDYNSYNLYTFDGSSNVGDTIIEVSNANFKTKYQSDISSMLLFFDNKFVSGGYSNTYNSQSISPFSDWSTADAGYAVNGPNYSTYNTTSSEYNDFKWITIDVDSLKSGNNIDLSKFTINENTPDRTYFGISYEAYIYQDGKFGALNNLSTTNTSWFNDNDYNTNISEAKLRPSHLGGASQGFSESGNYETDAFINEAGGVVYLIIGLLNNTTKYIKIFD